MEWKVDKYGYVVITQPLGTKFLPMRQPEWLKLKTKALQWY